MKYPCQGPNCHTRPTKDRFNSTTGCQHDWINANIQNIVAQRPITFIRERKVSEQTFHITEGGWLRLDEHLTND
jgi:hypothetical protein